MRGSQGGGRAQEKKICYLASPLGKEGGGGATRPGKGGEGGRAHPQGKEVGAGPQEKEGAQTDSINTDSVSRRVALPLIVWIVDCVDFNIFHEEILSVGNYRPFQHSLPKCKV